MQKIKKQKMTLEKLAIVIQQDFNDIKERFATKDDLKEAVAGLATKNELKEAVGGLATKSELKEAVGNLATTIIGLATKEELRQLHEEVINSRDEVLTSNDKIVKELKIIREEQMAHTAAHGRVDDKVEDHEARIIQLENQPSASV